MCKVCNVWLALLLKSSDYISIIWPKGTPVQNVIIFRMNETPIKSLTYETTTSQEIYIRFSIPCPVGYYTT